jgi:YaiO family outer membrane protein
MGLPLLILSYILSAPGFTDNSDVSPDPWQHAKELRSSGHAPEAIAFLKKRLEQNPTDGDLRVELGSMLAWDGEYAQAREVVAPLLGGPFPRGDAVESAIRIELWADLPASAEPLARAAIERDPSNPKWRVYLAKALRAQKRRKEALGEVDTALVLFPKDPDLLALRDTVRDELRRWEIYVAESMDFFSDGRTPWTEERVALKYQTDWGSAFLRYQHANRYGTSDNQGEIEWYPSIRPGTYAYLDFAYSPQHVLYPQFRYAVDLYQMFPHAFEVSAGFRQLWFSTDVEIYTAMVGKYVGNWYLFARTYLTPEKPGLSVSLHLAARYYFLNGKAYLGARVGAGTTSAALQTLVRGTYDLPILASDVVALEADAYLAYGWHLSGMFIVSREERTNLSPLYDYSPYLGLGYRF